jgi:AbrB family looped-hinge helix DNA binding protein
MLTDKMRLGPKGQVVIPKSFRKILKVGPGSEIIFRLDGEHVILEKESVDSIRTLEKIARKGKSVSRISPHVYEEALEGSSRRHSCFRGHCIQMLRAGIRGPTFRSSEGNNQETHLDHFNDFGLLWVG